MTYQVWFSPTSRTEILETFEYIRGDQRAPLNAARWLDGIIKAISNLRQFPHVFGLAGESAELKEDLRQCIYKSHRIIFDVKGNRVRIHRVIHAAHRGLRSGDMDRLTPKR